MEQTRHTSASSVGGGDSLRLFCALRLPDETVDAIVRWQGRVLRGRRVPESGERLVPRSNLHVTLAFLGGRPADELPAIADALRTAAGEAHDLRLAVHGYRETRSVGMLTCDDEGDRATAVAKRLHGLLAELGVYQPEKRHWLPHVTVLRFRDPPGLRPRVPDLGTVVPSDAAVYISRLRPGGAEYEVLEKAELGRK